MQRHAQEKLPSDFVAFDRSEVEGTIPDRFQKIVRAYPNRTAIRFEEEDLTYRNLDRASDRVAATILDRLGPTTEPVALLHTHGAEFVVSQLGVIKSGKFYSCLDPDLPFERLVALASDLKARLLLYSSDLNRLASTLCDALPDMVMLDSRLAQETAKRAVDVKLSSDSFAYIVYTSGSTGTPQGVIVSHRNALHFTMNQTNNMHLRARDRASQVCPLSSAACAGETFPILLNGAMLLPFRLKEAGTGKYVRWLQENQVSIHTSVPVVFRMMMRSLKGNEDFSHIRLIRLSGDRITQNDVELFQRHFPRSCLLRVTLGAAEALLYTQFYVDHEYLGTRPVVPAGYALEDMEILILDDDLSPLPANRQGEIAVRSKYLCVGYWNNPERTAERFIRDSEDSDNRIYLTRDVGFLENDGCLVHLCRKDFRTKIYGKLVALADIEEAMLRLPGICEAVVVSKDTAQGNVLIAYFTSKNGPSETSIRRHLLNSLAPEIIPKRFVKLPTMPVTMSNKIDRKSLAEIASRS